MPESLPLPAVRSDLHITVHQQQQKLWYAIRLADGRFIRCGRNEYLVAGALDGKRSLEEVIYFLKAVSPDLALDAESIQSIVAWLAKHALLELRTVGGAAKKVASGISTFNPIFTKIPLIDGPRLELVTARFVPFIGWLGLFVIVVLWIVGSISVAFQWDVFLAKTSNLFVSDGYLWWAAAWLVLKAAHELGHAVAATAVGSRIRSAGLSLIFLAPVPFVDLSDLWTISNRWHRMLCCAGGMLVELSIAAAAAIVALSTENQALQYFCCALATMGTVTTLAFNANPLIRFDGYYILSDLIDFPNLYTDAQLAARQFISFCFQPWKPIQHRMTSGLVIYGLACYQYRIVMMMTLAIGTLMTFQGVGILLVAWGAYATIIGPHLRASQLQAMAARERGMAEDSGVNTLVSKWINSEKLWMGGLVLALLLFAAIVPAPIQPTMPGYVALREPVVLRSESEGFLSEVFVDPECLVSKNQVLAKLHNPDLELELALKRIEAAEIRESIRGNLANGRLAELQAQQAKSDATLLQIQQLEHRVAGLIVRSPADGKFLYQDLRRQIGLYLNTGDSLGWVAPSEDCEIVASVSQNELEILRGSIGQTLVCKLNSGALVNAKVDKLEPRASNILDQPLLAAAYGGPLPVKITKSANGTDELLLAHPRFEMRLRLSGIHAAACHPGQVAWVSLPGDSKTILSLLHSWIDRKWKELCKQSEG